jgi:hypothetical protein
MNLANSTSVMPVQVTKLMMSVSAMSGRWS